LDEEDEEDEKRRTRRWMARHKRDWIQITTQ